ncbi:MAG: hypothetical protein K1X86_03780 [Ignavibacteria bacterium]|nr:hypothetical protein [Ignavibacteria bacterium]
MKKRVPQDIPNKILQRAAKNSSLRAKRENFALGLPITVLKNGNVVNIYKDGREVIIKKLDLKPVKVTKKRFTLADK